MRTSPLAFSAFLGLTGGALAAWFPASAETGQSSPMLVQANHPFTALDEQEVRLMSDLVQADDFVHINSKSHPHHKLRIKSHQSGWCDPSSSVRSYSGYLDAPSGASLFFYFFESRSKPEEDPVVMWINGGPGATSAFGLFMEQGPCRVKTNASTHTDVEPNPYSWTEGANMFFLDQPVGAGYSYSRTGEKAGTTDKAGEEVAVFVDMFFDTFKEFRGREFHMSGESYAGIYLPNFASAVVDQNIRLAAQGKTPINLKSVMIGNGAYSQLGMLKSGYDYFCTPQLDLGFTLYPIAECVRLAQHLPRCLKLLRQHCVETADDVACSMANSFCSTLSIDPIHLVGRNRFNVNQTCTPESIEKYGCEEASWHLGQWLAKQEVRDFLGVDPAVTPAGMDSDEIEEAFDRNHDFFRHPTNFYVAGLLERGVKVLNYVGTLDSACDHLFQHEWIENELFWSRREEYDEAKTNDWTVDGVVSGTKRAGGDYTFWKVYGAGHLVPADKPKEALALFREWMAQF